VSEPRRILYLVTESLSAARRKELRRLAAREPSAEIVALTESNSRDVLEKIFAADSVAFWGELENSYQK
jgi:hypothetical protein